MHPLISLEKGSTMTDIRPIGSRPRPTEGETDLEAAAFEQALAKAQAGIETKLAAATTNRRKRNPGVSGDDSEALAPVPVPRDN